MKTARMLLIAGFVSCGALLVGVFTHLSLERLLGLGFITLTLIVLGVFIDINE